MSSQRATLVPYKILSNEPLIDGLTITTSCRFLDNVSFQVAWSSNTSGTGTWKAQGSITPPALADTAIWTDLDCDAVALSGTSGNFLFNLTNLAFDKVRLYYTQSVASTGGVINAYTEGKGS